MPDRAWYYSRGGAQQGPVSSAELKKVATAGQLAPADLVWCEGMENWLPASTVKGLFPPTVSAPAALSAIGSASNGPGVATAHPPATTIAPASVTPQIHSTDSNDRAGGGFSAAQASQLARDASQQALTAFKQLMSDPVGKIGSAYEQLGANRAMLVGGVFVGVYVLCLVLTAWIAKSTFLPGVPGLTFFSAKLFFQALFLLVLFIGGLIGTATLFRVLARTGTHFAGDLFVVGAALLPIGLVALLTSVLNQGSEIVGAIIMALFVFAMITSLLILFSGLCKITRLNERMAGVAVATMLVVAGLLVRLGGWVMTAG